VFAGHAGSDALAPLVEKLQRQIEMPGIAKTVTNGLTGFAGAFVKGLFLQAMGFCLRGRCATWKKFIRAWSPLAATAIDRPLRADSRQRVRHRDLRADGDRFVRVAAEADACPESRSS